MPTVNGTSHSAAHVLSFCKLCGVPSDGKPNILSRLTQRTSIVRFISADIANIRAIRRPRREAECAASSGAQINNEWRYISFPAHQFMARRTAVPQLRGRRVCYEVLRGCARGSVDPGHCNSRGRDHTGLSGQHTLFTRCVGVRAPLMCIVCACLWLR